MAHAVFSGCFIQALGPLGQALGMFILSGLWRWHHISVKSLKVQWEPEEEVPQVVKLGSVTAVFSLPF